MAQVNNQVTLATQKTIANLYISILGRNPEPAGFGFWCDKLADNGNTPAAAADIARGFANSPEFIATYGGRTTEQAMTLMYNNVLNRAPDAGGLAFWVAQANTLISRGSSVADAYALTGAAIITTAGTNSSSDTALIVGKQNAAIASGTSAPATTYTLTTNIDLIDIKNGELGIINGTIQGANNPVTSTVNTGDVINGGAKVDTLNITATVKNATNLNLIELNGVDVVSVRALAVTDIDATLWTGTTSINTTKSTAALAVTNVANAVTIGATSTDSDIQVTYVAGALGSTTATQAFAVNNAGGLLKAVTAGTDKITAVTVAASGTESAVDLDVGAAVLTTLTVTGSGAVAIDFVGASGATLKTINASANSGGVTYDAVDAATPLKTLTGGTGGDTFTIAGVTMDKATIALGAGNDTLLSASVIKTTNTVDGGEGIDTIQARSLSAGNAANISNFEILNLDGASAVYDASLFTKSTFQSLELITRTALSTTVSNLAGTAIALNVNNTAVLNQNEDDVARTITATLKTSTGAADSFAVNFAGESGNATLGTLVTTGVETASIVSGGSVATTVNTIGSLNITNNTLTTITITGANSLNLSDVNTNTTATLTVATASALSLIDGSAATGVLGITAGQTDIDTFTTYTGLTINGGSGGDVITTFAKDGKVNAGAGNDTVTIQNKGIIITDAVGTDTLVVGTGGLFGSANYTAAKLGAIVTGFGAGDKIDIAAAGDVVSIAITNYTTTALTKAALADAINDFMANGATAVGFINWTDGNTYLVVDGATPAQDGVIALVGTYTATNFGASTSAAGVITLA